jgi:hypothetical protein
MGEFGVERDEKIVICDLYCMIMYNDIWTGLGGISSLATKTRLDSTLLRLTS